LLQEGEEDWRRGSRSNWSTVG